MTTTTVVLNGAAGVLASWLAVFFTKANAAALRKAQVAKAIGVIAGIVAAIVSPDFDATLVADQALEYGGSIALTLLASHTWWKNSLQPKIEADKGAVAALYKATSNVGIG